MVPLPSTDRSRPGPTVATGAPYVTVRETHSGVVLLVGDRAYKAKKPVDLGFLDFRSRERRRACCRREVELNRRLAPDVYLGLAELVEPGDPAGEPLVLMRRMPDDRRLSTLIDEGRSLHDVVVRLARMMATFHATADRAAIISAQGTRDAIEKRWEASFAQVAPLAEETIGEGPLQEIVDRVRRFLAGREHLFAQRITQGRVVDGHGDLICDDIFCLDDGPRVLDCLDFDDRLRYLDGLDDICFLAMDLERLGAIGPARLLLRMYADFAGDPAPPALRHHFIAYRAFVRVKVNCLRHTQGDRSATGEARTHADLATRHLRAGTVRMILVGGLPGAGKSTVSGLAADRLGAVLLATDRLRKEIGGVPPLTRMIQPYRHGLYDPESTRRTYAELLHRAERLLGTGESVVLDASWTDAEFRGQAASFAARVAADLVEIECWASPDVRHARLAARTGGMSDADEQIADRMATEADPWPTALRLVDEGPAQQVVGRLLDALGAAEPGGPTRRPPPP
jgi:aminoglycoside phosphotransferase family enzyme/predicted kinase